MNDAELLRYSRQIMLPELDVAGQEKILAASVAIFGLGGLGAPIAIYLTAAGVGEIHLIDDDKVDDSNLQRQVTHFENDIGKPKVDSAAETLRQLNSHTTIHCVPERLQNERLCELVDAVDLVLDGTDNFRARFDINQACVATHTPLVSGAAIRAEGQIAVFDPNDDASPCYQCLYADAADVELNCAENGVVAPLVGIIGTTQAMEALKLIAGFGETLVGYVLYLDAKRMEWRKFKLPKNPACPTCGVAA